MVNIDQGRQVAVATESRQERRRRQTRAVLYQAALRLFEQRGFDETTVQAITEAADAGKGTFFHYFPTKDHVLVAYWNEFNARLLDDLEAIQKRTVRTRLLAAVKVFGRAAASEPALGRVLLGRVFTSPALIDSDQQNEERLMSWLTGILKDGIARGELRSDADLDSFRHLFITSLSSTFREYIMFGGEKPAKLMDRRIRLLLRAIEESE